MTPLLLTADAAGVTAAFLMVLFIAGCLIGVLFYSLPSFIAGARGKGDQSVSISLVNLFFGWIMLGWLGCLIWAIWYIIAPQGDELIVRRDIQEHGVPPVGFMQSIGGGGNLPH